MAKGTDGLPRNSRTGGPAAAGRAWFSRVWSRQSTGSGAGVSVVAATVHVIDRLAGALVAGTVRAAGADAVGLDAVPDDRAAAVVAARRRGMARTFEAVADVP